MRGRAPRGQRLRASIPHGHWKTTTFVAGLRLSGMVAPMVLDGPINGLAFQAYVDQVLVPELREGDVVVMDNLGSHKGAGVRAARSADISTSITAGVSIRVLTAARRIKPTSPRCHSAWRPNPGRGSTYRRGNSVQTLSWTFCAM
uniref:Transposase n=1 Tax=Bradyrhizobium barranii subsp. barranii TaxID=2823807 RepID=A0A939M0K6_9BRAD